jgi:hypothetical protein
MKAQDILGSPPFVFLGIAISRTLPPRTVYWLAKRIARSMARRRNQMFSTVRHNLAHVVPDADDAELDRMAENAIYHAGRTYFDMFRLTMDDYRAGRAQVCLDAEAWEAARNELLGPRGTIIVGPHMSNFDLASQWFAAQGVEIQALSLAEPDLHDAGEPECAPARHDEAKAGRSGHDRCGPPRVGKRPPPPVFRTACPPADGPCAPGVADRLAFAGGLLRSGSRWLLQHPYRASAGDGTYREG